MSIILNMIIISGIGNSNAVTVWRREKSHIVRWDRKFFNVTGMMEREWKQYEGKRKADSCLLCQFISLLININDKSDLLIICTSF